MLGGAPARPQLVPNLPGRVREGGDRLRPPLLGRGIASLAGQLAVRERPLAGFLQRDQGESAEPELGPSGSRRIRTSCAGSSNCTGSCRGAWVTLRDIYRCTVDAELLARKSGEARNLADDVCPIRMVIP